MAVYSVFVPPSDDPAIDRSTADRAAFVRDGFTWSAAIFGPLWMLRHRLWLALIGYLVVLAILVGGLAFIRAASDVRFVAVLLIQILLGFEAASLRHWKLVRRGWRDAGIVVGDRLEAAERRFFGRAESSVASAVVAPSSSPMPYGGSEIVGLFPGAPR